MEASVAREAGSLGFSAFSEQQTKHHKNNDMAAENGEWEKGDGSAAEQSKANSALQGDDQRRAFLRMTLDLRYGESPSFPVIVNNSRRSPSEELHDVLHARSAVGNSLRGVPQHVQKLTAPIERAAGPFPPCKGVLPATSLSQHLLIL